jgi:hypothetical protein
MDRPELVADHLGEEPVVATVDLGGGDAVYTTPTRTLVYRSDGILRDESVEEYSLDVERVDVADGRRKTTVRLSTPEGRREFTVPDAAAEEVLEAVLAGVLRVNGRIERDETVRAVYRFSELALVVTDGRLLKHVGGAVWAPDHEVLPFADLTRLDFEEGSRTTQLVLEVEGRAHRIKLPTDRVGVVRRTVERAVFAFHGVDSLAELDERLSPADPGEAAPVDAALADAGPTADAGDLAFDVGGVGDPPATDEPTDLHDGSGDVEARLDALEAAVERQTELLERQQETLERLVDELRRGR